MVKIGTVPGIYDIQGLNHKVRRIVQMLALFILNYSDFNDDYNKCCVEKQSYKGSKKVLE